MLRCIGKNVIVELENQREYEKNGIIIKSSKSSSLIGNVVFIGKEVTEISIGDRVFFDESDSKKIVHENNEYYIINERDILAII